MLTVLCTDGLGKPIYVYMLCIDNVWISYLNGNSDTGPTLVDLCRLPSNAAGAGAVSASMGRAEWWCSVDSRV